MIEHPEEVTLKGARKPQITDCITSVFLQNIRMYKFDLAAKLLICSFRCFYLELYWNWFSEVVYS